MNDEPPNLDKGPRDDESGPRQPPPPPPSSPGPYAAPNPYQQGPAAPGGVFYAQPDHPQATTVLILGILSWVVCGVIGPFAWIMGNRVVAEIDASHGAYGGRSNANLGRILGIVSTALIALVVLGLLAFVVIAIVAIP